MSSEIIPLISIQNDVQEIFYDPKFMLVLERNLPLLIDTAIRRPVEIERALKYKGNFDGLCIDLDISHDHIWIVMRMNGLRNCYDFNGKIDSILVPADSTLTMISSRHMQIQKML